jgi:hypothetical protein
VTTPSTESLLPWAAPLQACLVERELNTIFVNASFP